MSRLPRTAPWVLVSLLLLAAGAISPARAQVNIGKVGDAAGDKIKESAGGSTTQSPSETPEGEAEGDAPAEGETAEGTAQKPGASPSPDPALEGSSSLDAYALMRRKTSKEEMAGMIERAKIFLREALEPNVVDVKNATFPERPPWQSKAPRPNPFDPQLVQELPFAQLNLPTTPPEPYYAPHIESQNAQENFQAFLDKSEFSGVVTVEGQRWALVKLDGKVHRVKTGMDVETRGYAIKIKDVKDDVILVTANEETLNGVLTLGIGGNLIVGEGEKSLIIISPDENDRGGED